MTVSLKCIDFNGFHCNPFNGQKFKLIYGESLEFLKFSVTHKIPLNNLKDLRFNAQFTLSKYNLILFYQDFELFYEKLYDLHYGFIGKFAKNI